jgi:phosphoglycerate dehydrogenase-like enzyme
MRVIAIDEMPVDAPAMEDFGLAFAGGPDDLDGLLSEADYVSLHLPLTPVTDRLIDRRRIALLKRSAVLINVARGGLIDEDALIEALEAGRIAGAGLDVFTTEPLAPDHPFLRLDNVIATPHVAGGTRGTSRRRGRAVAENVMRVLRGKPILYTVAAPTEAARDAAAG